MNKHFDLSEDEMSKKIDQVIEEVEEIKSQIPQHARGTEIREKLDEQLRGLRWVKKKALTHWRDLKRNPRITPCT